MKKVDTQRKSVGGYCSSQGSNWQQQHRGREVDGFEQDWRWEMATMCPVLSRCWYPRGRKGRKANMGSSTEGHFSWHERTGSGSQSHPTLTLRLPSECPTLDTGSEEDQATPRPCLGSVWEMDYTVLAEPTGDQPHIPVPPLYLTLEPWPWLCAWALALAFWRWVSLLPRWPRLSSR